jgi:hypothetical protein
MGQVRRKSGAVGMVFWGRITGGCKTPVSDAFYLSLVLSLPIHCFLGMYYIQTMKVSGDGKSGFFIKHKGNIVILDDVSATWLRVTSESTHKPPSELIGEMIREKIAVAI